MQPKFSFSVDSITVVSELPGYWTEDACRKLLQALEFDGIDSLQPAELRDYAIMSLQDLDPPEAARALLDFTLADWLSAGKKQNASEEMQVDRLWEEYPDLACHEPIFNAQVLLAQAFPSVPTPEVNLVEATLLPLDQATEGYLRDLSKGSLPEALVTRCIAAASPDTSILNRLFEDQLAGNSFPEAEHLVWQVQTTPKPALEGKKSGLVLRLFSPIRWTDSLEEGTVIECSPIV